MTSGENRQFFVLFHSLDAKFNFLLLCVTSLAKKKLILMFNVSLGLNFLIFGRVMLAQLVRSVFLPMS